MFLGVVDQIPQEALEVAVGAVEEVGARGALVVGWAVVTSASLANQESSVS